MKLIKSDDRYSWVRCGCMRAGSPSEGMLFTCVDLRHYGIWWWTSTLKTMCRRCWNICFRRIWVICWCFLWSFGLIETIPTICVLSSMFKELLWLRFKRISLHYIGVTSSFVKLDILKFWIENRKMTLLQMPILFKMPQSRYVRNIIGTFL